MAGGYPAAHAADPGLFGQHFKKARVRVVGFVAMHIHQATGALSQVHQELDRADALLAGVFKVRNATDHIGAHLYRASHQLAAASVRLDTFLGERHNLQVDQPACFFADFKHRFERGQRRVRYVDMGAHVLNAMLGQHADGGVGALFGVFVGDGFLALRPALDAFEQRTAQVPLGLARSQGCIQVDMRFNQGRDQQLALSVDIARLRHHTGGLQGDGANALAFAADRIQAWSFT